MYTKYNVGLIYGFICQVSRQMFMVKMMMPVSDLQKMQFFLFTVSLMKHGFKSIKDLSFWYEI
jgi:hypothetical protein